MLERTLVELEAAPPTAGVPALEELGGLSTATDDDGERADATAPAVVADTASDTDVVGLGLTTA